MKIMVVTVDLILTTVSRIHGLCQSQTFFFSILSSYPLSYNRERTLLTKICPSLSRADPLCAFFLFQNRLNPSRLELSELFELPFHFLFFGSNASQMNSGSPS